VSAELASPTDRKRVVVPRDKVRALQHTLYRAAKADPGRRLDRLGDSVDSALRKLMLSRCLDDCNSKSLRVSWVACHHSIRRVACC